MNKFSKISLVVLAAAVGLMQLALGPLPAESAVQAGATQGTSRAAQSSYIHTDRLREVAASAILRNGPWRSGEVELAAISPIPSLSFPPGKVEMIPGTASFRPGYASVSVLIKVDGKEVRTVPVSFQVKLSQWVLVTRGTVPPDTRMEDVPLERVRRTVTGSVEQYPSQQTDLSGMVSRTYIPGGRVLTYDLVRPPFDVRRGTIVALVARAGAVEVSLTGKAMRDGRRGDRIPVYNMEARKEVEGIVTGPGTVEIKVR